MEKKYVYKIDLNYNRYTRQDGKAYTEDGVLVYTLHLSFIKRCGNQYFIHDTVNISGICKFFEKYGPVVAARMGSAKVYDFDYQYALVTFEKAEDACKALNEANNIGYEDYGGLSPADSWEQPFCEEMIRRRRETYNGPINKDESPIFRLNDDELMYLYSFLDLHYGYTMSKLCERFENAFEAAFRKLHKIIRIDDKNNKNVTLLEWRQILKQYGHLIEEFLGLGFFNKGFSNEKSRFMEYVPICCPNLNALELYEDVPYPANYFDDIVSNLKSLHTIKLHEVDDEIVFLLSQMDSIQRLTVNSHDITGLHLDSFERLEHLSLWHCTNLNPLLLIKMFEKVPTLTTLEFSHCAISDEVILKISELCGQLRDLRIIESQCNFEPLARLCNLEYLDLYIDHSNQFSDNFFLNLVANLKDKLRVLVLKLDYVHLTDVQKECICKLTALEELTMRSYNTVVDDKFLAKMSSLKNLQHFETKLCSSSISVKPIIHFILNAPRLEEFCMHIDYTTSEKFTRHLVLSIVELLRTKSREPLHLAICHCGYELEDIIDAVIPAHKDLINITVMPTCMHCH